MEKEELINKYFLDELGPEDLQEFNNLLETDSVFRKQFEFERNVQLGIQDRERGVLKEKLRNLETEHIISTDKSPSRWRPLSIAATVAALLAVGWYVYNSNFALDTEQLYAVNYEKYPNTVYTITRGNSEDNSVERQAFVAYETNDNIRAIELFKEIKGSKNHEYIDFYLAQAYLNDGREEDAQALFKKVITADGEFSAEALWYLSLSHLKIRDKEKAIKSLKELVNKGTYKRARALSLLAELE